MLAFTNVAAMGEKFCIENRRTGGAAAEVMREQNEANIEHRTSAHATDDDGHAAAGVAVETRLRTIGLVAHLDGLRGRGRASETVRLGDETTQSFDHVVRRSAAAELERNCF